MLLDDLKRFSSGLVIKNKQHLGNPRYIFDLKLGIMCY